jgi:hypothetical protein
VDQQAWSIALDTARTIGNAVLGEGVRRLGKRGRPRFKRRKAKSPAGTIITAGMNFLRLAVASPDISVPVTEFAENPLLD